MKKLFIDELISSPRINGANNETQNHLKQDRVFLVQNIVSAVPEKNDFFQLPVITPPYENCWFEWTLDIKKSDNIPDDFSGELDDRLLSIMLNMEGDFRAGVHLTTKHNDKEGWYLYFQFFLRFSSNLPLMFPIAYVVKLNADGYFENIKKLVEQGVDPVISMFARNMIKEDIAQGFLYTVIHALGLLNCKNVVIVEKGGLPKGGKRNRHRKWEHRHYILQIHPMKEITKTEHELESIEQRVSYHFCRGHFKTYTTEKPLFGKYYGTFWWDAHARGSIEVGIVTKDYSVNPPEK